MTSLRNDEKLVYEFHEKSHRWLSNVKIKPNNKLEFEFNITLKNKEEDPEEKGKASAEYFISNLNNIWKNILSELLNLNPIFTQDNIESAIENKIYIFSPALVGSTWYELMILIKLETPEPGNSTSIICFEQNRIISSEVLG